MRASSPNQAHELLTVREVAERYRVHVVTVKNWVRKGIIAVVRVGPTRRVRITAEEAARHFVQVPGAQT